MWQTRESVWICLVDCGELGVNRFCIIGKFCEGIAYQYQAWPRRLSVGVSLVSTANKLPCCVTPSYYDGDCVSTEHVQSFCGRDLRGTAMVLFKKPSRYIRLLGVRLIWWSAYVYMQRLSDLP